MISVGFFPIIIHYTLVAATVLGHRGERPAGGDRRGTSNLRDTVSLATITVDTGAFAVGNTDFTRFTVPGMCLAAATEAADVLRHTVADQRAERLVPEMARQEDTVPAGAATIARTCGERFTVAGTSTDHDLVTLFTLALMGGEDDVARAVLQRRLALAASASMRDSVRQQAIEGYLAAKPARVDAAEAVAAQVDALGPRAQIARLYAHDALQRFALERLNEPLMREQATQILALDREVPLQEIEYDDLPIIFAYITLGELAYIEAPDSASSVMARAKEDLQRFPTCTEFPPGHPWKTIQCTRFNAKTVDQVGDELLPFNQHQFDKMPPPPLTADYWIPKAPSTWPPGHGKPSLVFYDEAITHAWDDDWALFWAVGEGSWQDPLYTVLPQLIERYGDQFTITFVIHIGHSAVRSLYMPPSAVADSIGWFYRDHLKLPVTVGAVFDTASNHPWSEANFADSEAVAYQNAFGHIGDSRLIMLYDAHGTLRYAGDLDVPVVSMLLARMLRDTSAATVPASAPAPTGGR